MAEQLVEDQYDVDLTADSGEYETSQEIDAVDLFEYVGDEDSPISQLKSLVLSIDWEITDEILEQFIDELSNLRTVWADDKVKQVYIQGLDKIAKYIYKEKANANPNAIKLLLTFYHDLEKIVTSESMDYEEKKRILLEDVKKFEVLKSQIFHDTKQQATEEPISSVQTAAEQQEPVVETVDLVETDTDQEQVVESTVVLGDKEILRGLKAAVLGIDWEITDQELNQLAEEVHKLEESFRNSKAKLIFLQGIGALGAYINLKRSNAHAGAFTLLRSFFDGMEKVVVGGLSGEEEKQILLAEAEKFNEFKKIIAETIPKSADKIQAEQEAIRQDEPVVDGEDDDSEPAPALSETSEDLDDYSYINEEDEHADDVESGIESFFNSEDDDENPVESEVYSTDIEDQNDQLMAEIDEKLQDFFDAETEQSRTLSVDSQTALQGVHVESPADDDSDEEPLPMDENGLAPALSSFDEEQVEPVEQLEEDTDISKQPDKEKEHQEANELTLERLMEGEDTDYSVDQALKGVDVETEADDESDEPPLPIVNGELAPALPGHDGKSGFSEEDIISTREGASAGEDIKTRLDEFFADDKLAPGSGEEAASQVLEDKGEIADDDESLDTTKERLDEFFAHSTDDDLEMELEPVGEDVEQPSSEELFMEEATLIQEEVDEAEDEAEEEDEFIHIPEEELTPVKDESMAFDAASGVWEADDGPVIFTPVDDEDVSDLSFEGLEVNDSDQGDDFLFFDDIEEESEGFDDIDFSVPGQDDDTLIPESLVQDGGAESSFDLFDDQDPAETADIQTPAVMPDELPARYSTASTISLENLQDYITTVGIEMTLKTIRDLLTEVGRLSQQLRENPVEKGLLNLLTTVVQQIQQGGRTIQSSGYSLMRSIVDQLQHVVQSSLTAEQAQESLLGETSKVLLWQQTILDIQIQGEGSEPVPVSEGFVVNVDDDSEDDEDESFFFEDDMEEEEDEDQEILVDDA